MGTAGESCLLSSSVSDLSPEEPVETAPDPLAAPEPENGEPSAATATESDALTPPSVLAPTGTPPTEEPAPEPAAPEPAADMAEPAVPEPAVPEPAVPEPAVPVEQPEAQTPAPGEAQTPAPGESKPRREATRVLGGLITAISSDEIDLTLDDGRPAVISRRNFDAAGTDPSTVYNPGDRVEGALLNREDPKNRVVLSRAWALKRQAWDSLAEAVEKNEPVSARATGKSKRGLVVDVHGVRGFVPTSHLELEPPTDLASYVGQTLELKILDCDEAKDRLVLSRRSRLLKEQRKAMSNLLGGLVVGETRTGTVASLVDYGAFVDLGGVTGLVHLSELSWSRVRHPRDVVSVGDELEVKILDVKIKKKRISLSHRQVTPDPFDSVPVDEIVVGTVTRLVDFGAFIDVGGGLEGLVHITELAEFRVFTPEEIVTPGEEVRVKVLSVDRKRRRVELSIRQAAIL